METIKAYFDRVRSEIHRPLQLAEEI